MEKEFNLYHHIIKAVEIQIESNNPPVSKETYERLLDKGYDSETVMEMMASVIAEEIYSMMKRDNKQIDENELAQRYATLE